MARPRKNRRGGEAETPPALLTHHIGPRGGSSMNEERLGNPAFRFSARPEPHERQHVCVRAIGADDRTPSRGGFCLEMRITDTSTPSEPTQVATEVTISIEDAIVLRNFLTKYIGS